MYTEGEWKARRNALGTWTIQTDLEHIGQIYRFTHICYLK